MEEVSAADGGAEACTRACTAAAARSMRQLLLAAVTQAVGSVLLVPAK